jgi:hypothetical protein
VTGLTLDTGALIALERGDERIVALLDYALARPDASVVVCARRYRQPVVTGDTRDLRRLDPKLSVEAV